MATAKSCRRRVFGLRLRPGLLLLSILGLIVLGWGAGCATHMLADAADLREFPLPGTIAGAPPPSGLRYWRRPFAKLPYTIKADGNSYVSILQPPGGGLEFWANEWGEPGAAQRTIFVRRGSNLQHLGEQETCFDSTLIDDVPDMTRPEQLAPGRGFTRTSMLLDPELGYVLLTCVCPEYKPGAVPLLPALVVSKTGAPGAGWKYLGKLKGEPETEAARTLAEMHRHIWSDGGTLLRLKDGRWRIYLNGFGQKLAALESDGLEGPWKFLRDSQGSIRELLPDFPCGGVWANVLRLREDTWHLWLTDTYPPQAIWHYQSSDGLTWTRFGRQPEITRAAVGWRPIKCLRTYYDREHDVIVGHLAVWETKPAGDKGWCSYISQFPASARP